MGRGMKGGKKEEQASGGPLALTGNPGLQASEGRWLVQSVPIIEADRHVAPRKAAQTGTDRHPSCHFLSRQPALTPHFILLLRTLWCPPLSLLHKLWLRPNHLPQPGCSPRGRLHTHRVFLTRLFSPPLLFCIYPKPLHPVRSRYNLFHNNDFHCKKLSTKHLNVDHRT